MGNKFHRNGKEKIKGTGDKFILEDYDICDDDLAFRKQPSIIRFDPKLVVSGENRDPLLDYKVIKNLGEGTFGKVDLVEHKLTGMIRAMKIMKKATIDTEKNNEASVKNELNILKSIDHQNVVKLYEYYVDSDNYYLITEYCPGGDLFDVTKNDFLSEKQVACIIYQILLALNHIHKMKIMHRDLKPENILVVKKEENGLFRVKLCDFGTSHLFKEGEKQKNITGSSYYIAPEVLKKKYNFKCDLWSLGVIMYILLTKKIPFFGKDDKEIRKSIKKNKFNPEPIQIYSKYTQDLIADLLEKDIDKRLNAEKALTYEIFNIYDCKGIINQIELNDMKPYIENIKKYKRHHVFKETAITYLIHNTDTDEVSKALKIYNKLDKKEKGKLTFMEFQESLKEVTGENFNEEEAKKIFVNLDSNKNNYIEQEEFVKAAIDKKIFLSEKMIRFAFNFFDVDNSGKITMNDIIQLFKDNVKYEKEAENEFKKIIELVDIDSDGQISFEEFSKFMKSVLEE